MNNISLGLRFNGPVNNISLGLRFNGPVNNISLELRFNGPVNNISVMQKEGEKNRSKTDKKKALTLNLLQVR